MHPLIPQAVGVLAVTLFLLSYQLKKRKHIIIVNTVSRCLYILQYILLGAFAGAAVDVLGALACVVASKKDAPFIKKHLTLVIIITDALIVTAGLLLCKEPLDLLPIIGVLLHTGAFWLTDERIIRRVSLLGSPFWFVYNFYSRAYGSALGDVLTMVSIIIAMIKFRKHKKEETKNV